MRCGEEAEERKRERQPIKHREKGNFMQLLNCRVLEVIGGANVVLWLMGRQLGYEGVTHTRETKGVREGESRMEFDGSTA